VEVNHIRIAFYLILCLHSTSVRFRCLVLVHKEKDFENKRKIES